MASVSYTPEPHEKPYFDALFQAADVAHNGFLGGAEAVAFFSRSKLPVDVLKNVWTLADQNPANNALDAGKFYTALRLIQLAQNSVQGQGAALAAPPETTLKPVMFEGISGVTIPLPPPAAAPAPPPQASATPPRPPQMPRPPAPAGLSTALTAQDPYSLPPNEQSRYEQIFPQYAKDGYVYGKEAVELFSRSGVPQDKLGAIWNMVDTPVDNRLDALEFAMAMHLIVCISKKNLPMPASLPMSLKMLKSQQPQQQQQASPALTPTPGSPQVPTMSAAGPSSMSVPQLPIPAARTDEGSVMSNLSAPPPLAPTGGVSITDAFEGLSTTSSVGMMGASGSLMESTPAQDAALSYDAGIQAPSNASGAFAATTATFNTGATESVSSRSIPEPTPAQPPAPAMQVAAQVAASPAPTLLSTKELAASYDQGDEHQELVKLKATLQKLQAENISLKASLGHMSEEEKDVQKEISATVAEIGRLSSELTTLRAQTLAAKSALLEATASLKGHKDKQAELNDLIGETRATKEALDTALEGVSEFGEQTRHQPEPVASNPVNEADLFGFDVGPVAAPLPTQMAPMVASVPSEDSDIIEEVPVPTQQYQPEPTHEHAESHTSYGTYGSAPAPAADHQRVPSYAMDGVMGGLSSPTPAPFVDPAAAAQYPSHDSVTPSSPSAADVEQLKSKAAQAEQTAREAESTSRALASQIDDLRKIADQAESEAREKTAAAEKKKGGFGRGKKKDLKGAEKAKQEAAQKRKDFMDMQGQANTAQTVAMQTRQEAERLRDAAETAEMEAVAAQSRETHTAEMNQQTSSNGAGSYGLPQDKYGQQAAGGMGQMDTGFGNGLPLGYGGGFDNEVMGGSGGMGIPSPADLGNQPSAYPW